jgi:NADPH:quinone reductase-like Zn-dependent oxidoreductase
MKAVFQTRSGKPDVLTLGDLPNPTCGPKDVLISNLATSVNPRDCLIRAGRYQLQFLVPKFPLVLGSDCYGRVLLTGADVSNFKAGDLVYGLKNPSHGLGTYADHVVIPAKNLAQAPANISAEQAAGVPLCALTAWQALVGHGQLNKGHKVLVIGASGGVGSFAVQVAKALSSNVDGICSAANAPFVESLGADRVYDYKTQDIKNITGQYDIIFDTIGRHSPANCHHLLSKNSTFVTTVPAPIFLLKHLASKFLSLLSIPHIRKRVVMVKPNPKQLTAITEFIQQNKIVPAVDSVYAMEDVAEAHLRSQSKRAVGKIIIRTQPK